MDKNNEIFEHVYSRLEKELPSHLTYHNLAHTQFVVRQSVFLAETENLKETEINLIKIAALYHDTGFLRGPQNHEEKSCDLVQLELPQYDFSTEEIKAICGMIMATKIPQQPHTISEKIVADADLFYLGTDRFEIFSNKLFQEMKYLNPKMNQSEWLEIQQKFISSHSYHTNYGIKVLEPVKRSHLKALMIK